MTRPTGDAATRNALDAGAAGVVLFTDLANPAENRAVVQFSP